MKDQANIKIKIYNLEKEAIRFENKVKLRQFMESLRNLICKS